MEARNQRNSSSNEGSSWSQSRASTPPNGKRRVTESTVCSSVERRHPSKPIPPTLDTSNLIFLEKFENGLDKFGSPATASTENFTPRTPTSLGVPPPPREQSRPRPISQPQLQPPRAHPQSQTPKLPPLGAPPIKWSRLHEYVFIFTMCLAQFISLGALAQTVAPLSIIGDDLKVDNPGQLSWFTAAYSMSLGAFILPAGRIGDMYGHKRIFVLGWMWLALWSFMAGFAYAWGPIVFSLARGFQGIGPALLVPNAMALIGRTFPMGNRRNIVFSLFASCGPTGFLTGALISSAFAQKVWWPWSFWSTALAALVITMLAFVIIPESMAVPAAPPGQAIPSFDFLGALTGITGLILINFALNQAPLVSWKKPYVFSLFIIGVMMTGAFIYVELKRAKFPLVPMRGLQPQAVMTLACIAAGWASHGIWIYYYFLFMEKLRQESPLRASVHLIPVGPIGFAWALSTGFLIKRFHVSKVMLLAMIFFFVGIILLAFAPPDQTYWAQTFLSVIITPGGMNLSFPAGTILLSNAMPREHQGKAASLVSTIVNYSIASGLGFAGSIEHHIDSDGSNLLAGYRGALDLGVGFSGAGILISLYFVWKSRKE